VHSINKLIIVGFLPSETLPMHDVFLVALNTRYDGLLIFSLTKKTNIRLNNRSKPKYVLKIEGNNLCVIEVSAER